MEKPKSGTGGSPRSIVRRHSPKNCPVLGEKPKVFKTMEGGQGNVRPLVGCFESRAEKGGLGWEWRGPGVCSGLACGGETFGGVHGLRHEGSGLFGERRNRVS